VAVDQVEQRAARYRALGDVHRLAIVDALRLSDHTPTQLSELTGLASNLLAFHLDVLEDVGLVVRQPSQGDRRRRYVRLRAGALDHLHRPAIGSLDGPVLFVCTGNSARSPLAAAAWTRRTGRTALSAGTDPAAAVHPLAVGVARAHGLDLSGAVPCGYDEITVTPGLVVSVCDRARESGPAFDAPLLHWSVPDPAAGDLDAFRAAYEDLDQRVERLAAAVAA
jgi:protein-tyrosine-phosphatase